MIQVGPPLPAADLLTFVKAAFSCRQAAGGRVFVHSRVGLDSCLLYATLETMLAQGSRKQKARRHSNHPEKIWRANRNIVISDELLLISRVILHQLACLK